LDAVLDANSGGVMTKRKPRLLDLFCCAGGAAMGYHRAGFEVVGVDIAPQPRYPFEFHQADAMTFPLEGFDAIHASPPCQAFTTAGRQWRAAGKEYPDLVVATRQRLIAAGVPYVIENVQGAPLINPTILNGAFFRMLIRRVRHFETSFPMPFMLLPKDARSNFRMGRPPRQGEAITPVGHFSGVAEAKRRMDIDWMNQGELAQAIPPAYTEYIGRQLMALQS
jgi:DNA (cytosine-5)-methyltransferase 1